MYEFIDRLFNVALPRVRDFRGINPNSFDGRGNYSLGLREQLILEKGREPQIEELAKELGVSREELVLAMDSQGQVESLQKTIYQSDGNEISLGERLPQEENQQEKVVNRMFLEQALNTLDKKERELIYLRFFQDRTQSSIAGELGMSQVQVSRMEKKILKRLREKL